METQPSSPGRGQDAESALESRYALFEEDGGSSNLGQRNVNDTDTRTKVTHIEHFGCGIIGTVSSLAYGTWQGQPAALLVLLFSLRGRESGLSRFTKAEFSITFRSREPDATYPVVRSIKPSSNLNRSSGSEPTLGVRASSSFSQWPPERFSIIGRTWSEESQEEEHIVQWRLAPPRGSKSGICESTIPLATIVTFSSPFIAIVNAKATTASKLKLQTFPWSRDDPLLFDGMTPKGMEVPGTDGSGLDGGIPDWLSSSSTQGQVSTSTTGSSTTTVDGIKPAIGRLREPEQSRQVYRVRGIPPKCPRSIFVNALSLAFSLSEDSIQIKAFSSNPHREGNVALVSFRADPAELSLASSTRQWHLRLPSQLWAISQDPSGSHRTPSSGPIEAKDIDLYFDTDFLGFTDIGIDLDPPLTPNVDIVAIHGLGGHAFGSFKQRKGPYMWLQESLASDLANSPDFGEPIHPRILVYGYNARVDNSQSFQGIEDLAIDLRVQLQGVRQKDPERPLVFIGHSLGGLLIKDLLIQCAEPQANPIDSAILKATIGVLFFGVPNDGMDITATLSIIGSQPNSEFLASLGIDSLILANQANLFPQCFDSRDAVIYSFYETCVSNTAKRVDGKFTLTGDPVVLVDKQSATRSRPWEMNNNFIIPIQRPHADLVKFEKYSPDYEKVRHCIEHILAKRFRHGQGSNG